MRKFDYFDHLVIVCALVLVLWLLVTVDEHGGGGGGASHPPASVFAPPRSALNLFESPEDRRPY